MILAAVMLLAAGAVSVLEHRSDWCHKKHQSQTPGPNSQPPDDESQIHNLDWDLLQQLSLHHGQRGNLNLLAVP